LVTWISGLILQGRPASFALSGRQIAIRGFLGLLIGRFEVIFLRRRRPALSEVAQICRHLTA